MKTTSTPAFQFSGYPLNFLEIVKEEKILPHILSDEEKAKIIALKISRATDAPENWDEAWFANYE